MALVKLRNNGLSVRTLPPVGNVNATVKGPSEYIVLAPGTTVEVDSERLKLYDSPAFNAAFEDRADGMKAELEILAASTPSKSVAALLGEFEAAEAKEPKKKTAAEAVK